MKLVLGPVNDTERWHEAITIMEIHNLFSGVMLMHTLHYTTADTYTLHCACIRFYINTIFTLKNHKT